MGTPIGMPPHFVVERPTTMQHGDYSTNVALAVAPFLNKAPRAVADEFVAALGSIEGIEKIEIAGPGFINFFLTADAVTSEITKATTDGKWGESMVYAGEEILIEYTSPNLFKPLHIGNLMGNILGESIARLLERSGASVKRINYPSDIGLSVAKGVWGLQKNKLDPTDIQQLGRAYVLGNTAYEEGTPEEKKEIEVINKKLYEGTDADLNILRKQGIETSLKHLNMLCQTLGTIFDSVFYESEAGPHGADIVQSHLADNIFEKSDGAVVFRGEKCTPPLHTRVFINSQGLPTYEAKDIGLFDIKQKAYPNFHRSFTVTGTEQKDYFAVVTAAANRVFPILSTKVITHIPNGFLRLTTGKMSSRKGNVITGESLLADLEAAAHERMEGREVGDAHKVAEQVAVGAIKYTVLKQGSGKDIIFDPEKSLSIEGDSGPYLQYAHTRALSLIGKAKDAGVTTESLEDISNFPRALELARLIVHYPEVVERAASELEPHYITSYLTELASAFNSWYANERLIGGEYPSLALLLTTAVEHVLAHGLHTLGIPAPREM